jgi:hypothetical protein
MRKFHRPFPISLNPQLVNCYDETGAATRRYSNDHVNNYTAANQQAMQSVRVGSVIKLLNCVNRTSADRAGHRQTRMRRSLLVNTVLLICPVSSWERQTSDISIPVQLTPADAKFLCYLIDSLKHEKKRRTRRKERIKMNEWK